MSPSLGISDEFGKIMVISYQSLQFWLKDYDITDDSYQKLDNQ